MSDKKELRIDDVDKNLKLPTKLDKDDIVFYNARQKPFEIYGLYSPEAEGAFLRMPKEVGEAVSENLELLNKSTAGGRVRFSTDSIITDIQTPTLHKKTESALRSLSFFTRSQR